MKRLMNFLMVLGLVLFLSISAEAKTIYVKSGSSGDGSSWANAYGDLQSGLDDADPDDEIWVAAGASGRTIVCPKEGTLRDAGLVRQEKEDA